MKLKSIVCLLIFSGALAISGEASAKDNTPTRGPTLKGASKLLRFAKHIDLVVELAKELDKMTTSGGELTLKSSGRTPVAKEIFFGVEFLVPGVEIEHFVTNRVLGVEVPGRRIAVKIMIDCYVEVRVDVANIKIVRQQKKDDPVLVVIPRLELIGRAPKGVEYQYEVEYGYCRAKWIDSDEARMVRKEMVTMAPLRAVEDFGKGEEMVAFRAGLKHELKALIEPLLPDGRRIEVVIGDEK